MQQPPVPTAFFGKTYGEALILLTEARNYLAYVEPKERARLATAERLRLCCETMRLTARLTQIMAWLLAQRAVHDGEISQEDALGKHEPLADLPVCMESDAAQGAGLPANLMDLLERSHRLYVRVARLDELARRTAT